MRARTSILYLQGTLWTYFPWPSYLLKAWIRRRYTPEKFGPSEEYHRSMFHRLSVVYAVTAWSALGVGIYLLFSHKESKDTNDNPLPYQKDIDKGGAMYWINALKTPEEMQDMGRMKIVKFQGLKYEGVEDVTVQMKELGQEKARRAQLTPDFYLRRRYDIPQESDGGPSIAEVREKIEAEGKDYMLELDYANQLNRAKTRYNPDGTVGEFI